MAWDIALGIVLAVVILWICGLILSAIVFLGMVLWTVIASIFGHDPW